VSSQMYGAGKLCLDASERRNPQAVAAALTPVS
jgi:hypothetical protein